MTDASSHVVAFYRCKASIIAQTAAIITLLLLTMLQVPYPLSYSPRS